MLRIESGRQSRRVSVERLVLASIAPMSKTLTVGVPDEVLPLSSSPPSPSSPLTRRALLVIIMSVAVLTSLLSTFMMTYLPKMQIVSSVLDDNNSSTATADGEGGLVTSLDKEGTLNNTDIADDLVMPSVRKDFSRWMAHLRAFGAGDNTAGIRSVRTACRELEANAQTCVFEGLFCVDVANGTAHGRAKVFIVDDSQTDGATVPSDNWCRERHQSADPRYFSARRWPFPTDTVAPQRSCLDARYRTTSSLFGTGDAFANNESAELASFTSRMKWLPSLALVDLDYVDNTHNNHLVKDILWLLDAALFQKSLSIEKRPGYTVHRALNDVDGYLFRTEPHIYLPQTRAQFEKQTSKDVNRLTYSIILRKNARRLYPNLTDEELHDASKKQRHTTRPLLETYPELAKGQLQFHGDLIDDPDVDLVCTPRLTVGAKMGNGAHERVCRELRTRGFELYGIPRPPVTRRGQINFPQPPKSVLILDRHVTRNIANVNDLLQFLKQQLGPLGVPVSYVSTKDLSTAEEFVRVYSSAGVILTPHGSHNMGQIWMHRYRYVFPVSAGRHQHPVNSINTENVKMIQSYSLFCGMMIVFVDVPITTFSFLPFRSDPVFAYYVLILAVPMWFSFALFIPFIP